MNSDNIKEQNNQKPVIARQKGKLGAVMIDPKTGKPIPDTWIPKDKVPQTALKYLNPEKFANVERRNATRQAQIDAEKQRLKGVGNPPADPQSPPPPAPSTAPSPAPARSPAPSPAPARSSAPARSPAPSPAPASTAEKIKGGLEVYKQQVKSGDVKGAETTGKSTWELANPTLAAAAAEKARIRGTQQTDNPLMKDMRSRLPMNSPSIQSPNIAKLANTPSTLAGNQRLFSNPNAFKAATPTQAIKAAPAASTPKVKTDTAVQRIQNVSEPAIKSIEAETKKRNIPTFNTSKMPKTFEQSYEYDAYDIVLEYLFDTGHVDTIEEANYVMLEMDETAIGTIMEQYKDYLLAEEIQEWVNGLVEEGYNLSQYTWDDMVEYYVSEARVDAGLSDDEKRKAREERGNSSFMNILSRRMKKSRGKKLLDEPGKNRYSTMQNDKKQAQRERDADEQRSRDRGGMSRGTWDKN